MKKFILPSIAALMLTGSAAFAQTQDPFGSDRGAQNSTVTIETLTVAHCTAGYKQGMTFSKADFDRRCDALKAAK